MSDFARLSQLKRLKSDIVAETLKLSVSHPKPGTHGWSVLEQKIAGWERTINLFNRNLKSRSHHAHMVASQSRFGPGAYAANQRLKSAESSIDTERQTLLDIAVALNDLVIALYGGPGPGQRALEGLKHAVKQLMTSNSAGDDLSLGPSGQSMQMQIVTARDALPSGGPVGGPQMPQVVDLFTLVLAYFVLLKALRKS